MKEPASGDDSHAKHLKTRTSPARASRAVLASGQPTLMLAMATAGFALTFWAWALLSPLGPTLEDELHLTAFQQALVVAVPVIVGSVGRIPVGALTDRLGARRMFPTVAALTVLPVLYLGHLAHSLMR
jgi:MFS transporter, NNP family, nitrate/nitrite transporter